MLPKKKAQQNGFMSFVQDWQQKNAPKKHWSACINNAGAVWEQMSLEERKPYNSAAIHMRTNGRGHSSDVYHVAKVIKLQHNQETKQRMMQRDIEQIVHNSTKDGKLETQNYHFVMVNYFTKERSSNVHTPAELAASEFSLSGGIQRVFHTLINPGVNVYGTQYDTQQHAKSTHQLPIPPKALGETNLEKVHKDLLQFLLNTSSGSDSDGTDVENKVDLPPVFTLQDQIPIVTGAIQFLNNGVESKLRIYSIEYLFYILKEATCNAGDLPPPKSIKHTTKDFVIDMFEHQSNISCDYHEKKDLSKYCAKSCVTRWGYTFASYMCADLAIKLLPNSHMPDNSQFRITITAPADSDVHPKVKQTTTIKKYEGTKKNSDRRAVKSPGTPLDIDVILNTDVWEALDDLEYNLQIENELMLPTAIADDQDYEESDIFTRRPKDEREIDSPIVKIELLDDDDDYAAVEKTYKEVSKERAGTDEINFKDNIDIHACRANSMSNRRTAEKDLKIKRESAQDQSQSKSRTNYIGSHDKSITPRKKEEKMYEDRDARARKQDDSPGRSIISPQLRKYDKKAHDQERSHRRNHRESKSPRRRNVLEFDEKRRNSMERRFSSRRNISPRRGVEPRPRYMRKRSTSRDRRNFRVSPDFRRNRRRSKTRERRSKSRENLRRSKSRDGTYKNHKRINSPSRKHESHNFIRSRYSVERNRDSGQKYNVYSREGNTHREKIQDDSRRRHRRSLSRDQGKFSHHMQNERKFRDSIRRSSSRERNFTHNVRSDSPMRTPGFHNTLKKDTSDSPPPATYNKNRKSNTPTPCIKKELSVPQEYVPMPISQTHVSQQYLPANNIKCIPDYGKQYALDYAPAYQYPPGYEATAPYNYATGSSMYEAQNPHHVMPWSELYNTDYGIYNTEYFYMHRPQKYAYSNPSTDPAFLGPNDLRHRLGSVRSNQCLTKNDLRFRITDRALIEVPMNGLTHAQGTPGTAHYGLPPTDFRQQMEIDRDK